MIAVAERVTEGNKVVLLGERLGLTHERLASILGVGKGTVTAYKHRTNANPSPDKIHRLVAWLRKERNMKVDFGWFFNGESDEIPTAETKNAQNEPDFELSLSEIPYYGEVPNGDWSRPTNDPETVLLMLNQELRDMLGRGELACVRAIGYSNAPRIIPGQFVLIKLSKNKAEGTFTLALNQEKELALKVLRWDAKAQDFKLESHNPDYPFTPIADVEIIGHAVGLQEFDPSGLKA